MQPEEIAELYVVALKKKFPDCDMFWDPFPPFPGSNRCTLLIVKKADHTKLFRYILKDGLNHTPKDDEINDIMNLAIRAFK